MPDLVGFLDEIAKAKRKELKRRFSGVTVDSLRASATPTRLGLAQAIAAPGARFILEVKKASPSAGMIRAGADTAAITRGYAGVADALSVLTDTSYFGGSLNDLTTARAAFDGPILAKDFFLDIRQVVEARIAGADAVLIMLSLLDDDKAREMIAEASRLGMDALIEVHDECEMQRALALDASLIGINNRDLRTLSIDLSTTERLASMAGNRLLVSESGISARTDVERLSGMVDGFLIGSALMLAEDPAQAARALLFGRVKLCGLNRAEDIAAGAFACFAGLVFAAGSPRQVSFAQATSLAGVARRRGMFPVGVFRNSPLSTVAELVSALHLHAVQLHGDEDIEYIIALKRQLPPGCEIWRALRVGHETLSAHGADRLLFDNGAGGTGRSFDWTLVRDHAGLGTGIVAGGIGSHNIHDANRLASYAVDVGSSVDAVPGIKSAARMQALFEAIRPASRDQVRECA